MKPIPPAQQLNCTFCGKSQQDSKRLIASPDHRAYICDECTIEPRRLQLISDKSEKSANYRVLSVFPNSRVLSAGPGQFSNERITLFLLR